MNDIKKELSALLYNFWIIKEIDPIMYNQIKKKQEKIKDFLAKNLGSNLIIHEKFIKLEKIPASIKASNGITTFKSVQDYVILSIFLMYLEDKAKGDKFVLSDLIEYIKNTAVSLEINHVPDWNKTKDRKSLINVINFLNDYNVIKIKDEDKTSFIENKDSDALYESMGISNYVMRLIDADITEINSPQDLLSSENSTQDKTKGDIRRYNVFRHLIYSPCVTTLDLNENEIDYIKKNRFYIKNELETHLDLETEITHNLALTYLNVNTNNKYAFPNTKNITDIVLLVNKKILDELKLGNLTLDEHEIIKTSRIFLEKLIKDIKEEKKPFISKTYQKLNTEKFIEEILDYMEQYEFISIENNEIYINPSISRMIGITREKTEEKIEQIDLFGGTNEQ